MSPACSFNPSFINPVSFCPSLLLSTADALRNIGGSDKLYLRGRGYRNNSLNEPFWTQKLNDAVLRRASLSDRIVLKQILFFMNTVRTFLRKSVKGGHVNLIFPYTKHHTMYKRPL